MRNLRFPLLVLVLAVAGVIYWRSSPRAEPSTVLAQVQQLNQLTTVRYTVQRVVTLTEEQHPVGSESILLIVQARVEAGVDLNSLAIRNVVMKRDGSVTVTLPPPAILNVSIDEKETRVWDRQKTWWTPWVPYSLDLEKRARMLGLDEAKQAAIEMGILTASEKNAEVSIRSLLGLAGFKNVVVVSAS